MRLGLRVPNGALHVLGAGQQGLGWQDNSQGCYLAYTVGSTKA